MFKWFLTQVREICDKPGGFLIFGQISFLLLSWGCLILILVFFMYYDTKVSALNIVLTIVVGFLGTMIGATFSEAAIKKIYESRVSKRDKRLSSLIAYVKELPTLLEEVRKKDKIKK